MESWSNADASLWYRKYDDGYIEQGGTLFVTGTANAYVYPTYWVTLPVSFKNDLYCVAVNSGGGGFQFGKADEQTNSRFKIGMSATGGNSYGFTNLYWTAFGY